MPKRTKPKNVVYLFGAGATQAELNYQSCDVNLLMKDNEETGLQGVCSRIMRTVRKEKQLQWLYEATKSTSQIDIEQLITLLEELNFERYRKAADKLRILYYRDILSNLRKTGILKKPKLSMSLFELHENEQLKETETLRGIICLNHDYLLEAACDKIHKGINLGVPFTSDTYQYNKNAPKIIKLYGSFNWRSGKLIRITEAKLTGPHPALLWLPPTTAKETKSYPFNKLLGMAYELLILDCDVLRVIGCSLNQNDWKVISLLFKTQCIRRDNCFDIELIQGQRSGEEIKHRLGFLRNVKTIAQLEGSFTDFSEQEPHNPYEDWLRKTIDEKRLDDRKLRKDLLELYYKGTRTDMLNL